MGEAQDVGLRVDKEATAVSANFNGEGVWVWAVLAAFDKGIKILNDVQICKSTPLEEQVTFVGFCKVVKGIGELLGCGFLRIFQGVKK